jgi:ABC-type antimicrobial peptide transport system permease subunit
MAIGADPAGVVRMVLKQGMILAGSGAVIGLLLSLAVSKPTATMVGGHGFNWPLVALVTLALLAMAALGVYLPARRASLVDPNTVLRQEYAPNPSVTCDDFAGSKGDARERPDTLHPLGAANMA